MKLTIRASVFAMVFAGAVATAFSAATTTPAPATHNNLVVSSLMPIPDCEPGTAGCFPAK